MMVKTRPSYTPAFGRQMAELVRAGRPPGELAAGARAFPSQSTTRGSARADQAPYAHKRSCQARRAGSVFQARSSLTNDPIAGAASAAVAVAAFRWEPRARSRLLGYWHASSGGLVAALREVLHTRAIKDRYNIGAFS